MPHRNFYYISAGVGKAVKFEDMYVDFGAKDGEEAKSWGVKPGCVLTIDSSVSRLGKAGGGGDLVIGAGFDDVCAVVSFIKALEILAGNLLERLKLLAVATVQEEIAQRGAQVSGFKIASWCAIASDVTHALAPGVKPSRSEKSN